MFEQWGNIYLALNMRRGKRAKGSQQGRTRKERGNYKSVNKTSRQRQDRVRIYEQAKAEIGMTKKE